MVHPLLYEINTRCWLRELSEKAGERIRLGNVSETEFHQWRKLGFTHIWLMGVWKTGPLCRQHALHHWKQQKLSDASLAEFHQEDVLGSPYAIAEYQVAGRLGGETGLKEFRRKLHHHGLRLILDFIPNHLGLDHPWISARPELFVQSRAGRKEAFAMQSTLEKKWFAHGKDPYFPAWTDTVQLDYRRAETRSAMIEALQSVASRCDGVRCDMAMLLLNDVFAKTWQEFPGPDQAPATEFWAEAIAAVKRRHPQLLFLAEVYWGLEARLQKVGFDFTYDKRFYDHLLSRNPAQACQHIRNAEPEFISRSAHFLENHDEPRIASRLSLPEHRAAGLLLLGLPGMRLLHEGQLAGARRFTPVQMGRRLPEPPQSEITALYEKMLALIQATAIGRGHANVLMPRRVRADNPTAENIVVVQWQSVGPAFDLVAVNLASHRSQCYVQPSVPGWAEHNWQMHDLLGKENGTRHGRDAQLGGLSLDLPEHGTLLLHFQPNDGPRAVDKVVAQVS
ncbi:MAG: alpha-amylase [Chloroflexi bacterium]|nr:alpha-amylase [Chloroflexota bacterium]